MIKLIREFFVRRQVRREQRLRERCIQYAGEGNCVKAARIYRFIVNGTIMEFNRDTKEYEELSYANLEGVLHPSQTRLM